MEWAKILAEAKVILGTIQNFRTAEWMAAFAGILVLTSFIQSFFIMHANRVARDAANAAHKIGNALQATERAYVAEQISDPHQIEATLSGLAEAQSETHAQDDIVAGIRFKNFGKTPATLKNWAASLYVDAAARKADSDAKLFPVRILAPSEETGEEMMPMLRGHMLTNDQAKKIAAGTLQLWASGFVDYEDIFGKGSRREFVWRYDCPQGCFVPHYFNIVEDDS
jgi:hypothetical protein